MPLGPVKKLPDEAELVQRHRQQHEASENRPAHCPAADAELGCTPEATGFSLPDLMQCQMHPGMLRAACRTCAIAAVPVVKVGHARLQVG